LKLIFRKMDLAAAMRNRKRMGKKASKGRDSKNDRIRWPALYKPAVEIKQLLPPPPPLELPLAAADELPAELPLWIADELQAEMVESTI
jgi:hypothetical protein